MIKSKSLEVYLGSAHVGTLAETREHLVAFQYADTWLESGFSISPLSLPLRKELFLPKKYEPFEGLFGVFSDSLPDGWGRLLVDRMLLKQGINPAEVSPLVRLSIIGKSGMGALSYKPSQELQIELANLPLDALAKECSKVFDAEHSEHLDELFRLGGSSGGARPKINYVLDGEEWLVKFPSSFDRRGIGQEEYAYSLCAKRCKIPMAETKLLPSAICEGYFATKRFDRSDGKRIHMISAGGLLETSHRIPNLDYNILMQLTMKITKSYKEIEKLFRLMCFNIFSHNRDDHSKNFSYLYKNGAWQLAPAYDLTYSNSLGGEHATTINGNGVNPGMEDILLVAKRAKLDEKWARRTGEEIRELVYEDLGKYLKLL